MWTSYFVGTRPKTETSPSSASGRSCRRTGRVLEHGELIIPNQPAGRLRDAQDVRTASAITTRNATAGGS
jgi:hypothetical protein